MPVYAVAGSRRPGARPLQAQDFVLPLIGPVYSPSITGVRFASGLFTSPNFVLHVSRGVGSKDPLRWNCPPELTWLDVTFQPPRP